MDYEWIIDTLESTWGDLDRYLSPRPEPDFDTPTALPGWSVRDLVAHLVGLSRVVLGEPVPTHVGPWPEYVKNPLGELNEAFVAAYRRAPTSEVLSDFREVNRRALDALRGLDDAGWEKVGWSPEGDRPHHRFQETRIVDSWIHYQDVRDALGEPREDHGIGDEIVLNRFEAALPYVVGKKVAPGDGTLIRLNLTGAHGAVGRDRHRGRPGAAGRDVRARARRGADDSGRRCSGGAWPGASAPTTLLGASAHRRARATALSPGASPTRCTS